MGATATITATYLNSSYTTVGITNMEFACLDDMSASTTEMQGTTDPYPSNAESLATTGNGEIQRLRYKIAELGGTQYWYHRTASYGRAQGITATNNSATPDTQFDLDADAVILGCSTCGYVTRINPGAAITNNVSTSGPAANGRDQSGAFSADSFIHFYWQWNGTTLSTTSSATAPPTGPTLTTGYTHWAYCCTVRFPSSALRRVYVRGAWVWHAGRQAILVNGGSTTDESVDVSGIVPSNATVFALEITRMLITTDGGGAVQANLDLQSLSGTVFAGPQLDASGLAVSTSVAFPTSGHYILPNVGQAFLYDWDVTTGSAPSASISVAGYSVPNGGE